MSIQQNGNVTRKRFKFVPPDGGWGYFICVSAIINSATTTSYVEFFGLIFNDFFIEAEMTSTNITMVIGILFVCMAIAAFFTNGFLKIMSTRRLALIAAVFFNVGLFSMVFVRSLAPFIVFQGIFPGIGFGILITLSMTVINDYFVTRRLQAVGIVQTIVAVTAMVAPIFIKWSLKTYGFRGTVLILSAVSMHNILGVVMMHPVKWHMKRVEIPIDSQELLLLLVHENGNLEELQKEHVTDIEVAVKKGSKIKEIENLSRQPMKNHGVRHFISSLIDLSLCKTFLLSCASFGPPLAVFADSTYILMLPQALYSIGWSQNDAAWVLSLFGLGDLAMRFMLIFLSKGFMRIGIQEIYILGLIIAFVVRLGNIWTQNFTATLIFAAIMGVTRCIIMILVPLVISEVVSPEQFTAALGILLLASGFMNFILSPIIGAVRDYSNSYDITFFLLSSIYAIVAIVWSMELFYKKYKYKWSTQKAKSSHHITTQIK